MPVHTHLDEPGLPRIGAVAPPEPALRRTDEIPLEWLRRLLRVGGRQLVLAAFVGGAIGVGVASIGPASFDGVATMLVMQTTLASDTAKPESVSTLRGLLATNGIAQAAVSTFHLDAPPYRLSADNFLRDALILEEVRTTNLIRVHARMPTPKLAADVANFVCTSAVTFKDQINRQMSTDVRGQLKGMLDDAAKRLKSAEEQLLDFRKRAQVDLSKQDADSALEQRGQLLGLTIDIEAEKARLARAEQEIKGLTPTLTVPRLTGPEAAMREIDTRPGYEATKTESAANSDKQPVDLTNAFINPVYQVLDYQITLSRTRLASLEARRRQMVGVRGLGGGELSSLDGLYPKEIQLRRLETEHELARTVYTEVALGYERAQLQIAGSTARLQLVDEAVPPTRALSRHRLLWAMTGAVAAAGLVLLAFVVREFLKRGA